MPAHDNKRSATNLAPMERVISIAGGALLIRKGLAIGGLLGLTDIAAGALGIFRGVTGICPAKRRMAARGGAWQGRSAETPAAAAAPVGTVID